jgi:hypothetical protein
MSRQDLPLTMRSYYAKNGVSFGAEDPVEPPLPPPPPGPAPVPDSYVDVAVPEKHGSQALQDLVEQASRNYLARHHNKHVLFAGKVSTYCGRPLTDFLTSGADIIRDLITRRIEKSDNITLEDVNDALAVSIEESPTLFFTYTLRTYLDEAVAEIGKRGIEVKIADLLSCTNFQLKTARYISLSISDSEASGSQKSYTATKAALKVRTDKNEALNELVYFVRKQIRGEEL